MDPVFYSENSSLISPPLEALSLPLQRFLVCLYSGTAIMSFCGNTIVLLVLIMGKKSSRELKKFLINLSLSDISMSLFSIPFTYTDFMFGRWVFPEFMCVFASMMTTCAMCVSVYTLTIIGIDRYFAIMRPLHPSRFLSNRSVLILVFVWIIGFSFSIPQIITTKVEPFTYMNQSYVDCREEWSGNNGEIYSMVLFFGTFLLPIISLCIIYGTIGYNIMRRIPVCDSTHFANSTENSTPRISDQRLRATIKAIKMMAIVVILFALCWTPIQVFNIVIWLYSDSLITQTDNEMDVYVGSFFVSHWMAMSHSCVNPIIYCFMSDNFREDFRLVWQRFTLKKHYKDNSRRNTQCLNTSTFDNNHLHPLQNSRITSSVELLPIHA